MRRSASAGVISPLFRLDIIVEIWSCLFPFVVELERAIAGGGLGGVTLALDTAAAVAALLVLGGGTGSLRLNMSLNPSLNISSGPGVTPVVRITPL